MDHDLLATCIDSVSVWRRQAYIVQLLAHDWHYEWSDDHQVWRRGSAERKELQRLADEIDETREIWNRCAPAEYRVVRSA
jgi:hypothetical protein